MFSKVFVLAVTLHMTPEPALHFQRYFSTLEACSIEGTRFQEQWLEIDPEASIEWSCIPQEEIEPTKGPMS